MMAPLACCHRCSLDAFISSKREREREGLPATDRAGTACVCVRHIVRLVRMMCLCLVDRADHRAAASCLTDFHTQTQARWCRCDIDADNRKQPTAL